MKRSRMQAFHDKGEPAFALVGGLQTEDAGEVGARRRKFVLGHPCCPPPQQRLHLNLVVVPPAFTLMPPKRSLRRREHCFISV